MQTTQIIDAIRSLSFQEKLLVLEQIFKEIKKDTALNQDETLKWEQAADALLDDYLNDTELTVFQELDQDEFYEA